MHEHNSLWCEKLERYSLVFSTTGKKDILGSGSTLAVDFLPGGNRMAVDPELLAILVCPKTKGPLELVDLKEETRRALVEKYREKFRDEEPVVTQGLYSREADLVYPIVSDIPVMLVDEALPGSELR